MGVYPINNIVILRETIKLNFHSTKRKKKEDTLFDVKKNKYKLKHV